jgi:tRNA A37 threonylcarbamoyladenosine synthetase subunit TsaC/SUA5/YrdC
LTNLHLYVYVNSYKYAYVYKSYTKYSFLEHIGKKNKEKVSKLGGLSTIIDLTRGKPVILRQGRGVIDLDSVNIDG